MNCTKCESPRGVLPRNPRRHGRDDLCGRCYGRLAARVRSARVAPEVRRRWNLAARYGLTDADVKRMLVEQEWRCAICSYAFGANFHVDHDHETGVVRGLLCAPCNWNLPMVENSTRLAAALAYLRRFQCDT